MAATAPIVESYTFRDGWIIEDHAAYDPHDEVRKATIFALANGYMSSRGAPESAPLSARGVVGHHVSGLYDTPDGDILTREMINLPAWTPLELVVNGQRLDLSSPALRSYTRALDMRRGLLIQRAAWRVEDVTVALHSERLVSLARLHLGAIHWELRADAACEIRLTSTVDANVTNRFATHHFADVRAEARAAGGALTITTVELGLRAVVAVAHVLEGAEAAPRSEARERAVATTYTFTLPAERPVALTKFAAVYDSRFAEGDLAALAQSELASAQQTGYASVRAAHERAWAALWALSDVSIEGDDAAQMAIRFCVFHLLANRPHDERVSVAARGLQGQDYWGSIFWDYEIYVLPFFVATQPEAARRSLIYRWHTLDGARRKAASLGYRGAYYAWQSQETGDETCSLSPFTNPRTGQKIRSYFADEQIHISADVAYGVWQYVRATGDWAFLEHYGLEMLCEIARFFASRAMYNEQAGRYEIRTVLGPDEYHERVDDNAYTNALAHYSLEVALEALEHVPSDRVRAELNLTDAEIEAWRGMLDRLYVPAPDPATGLIEQFDGYFALEDAAPDEVRARLAHPDLYPGGPLGPFQATQAIKQADVVLLLYLLRDRYSQAVKRANWEYYEPRTAHDSSLSPMAYALVAADVGLTEWAYRYFLHTALLDLLGAGPHWNLGVHTAALGGAWQAVAFGFCKLELTDAGVILRAWPELPARWQRVDFHVIWHGRPVRVTTDGHTTTLTADGGPVPVTYPGGAATLAPGQPLALAHS